MIRRNMIPTIAIIIITMVFLFAGCTGNLTDSSTKTQVASTTEEIDEKDEPESTDQQSNEDQGKDLMITEEVVFETPVKTPHYEDNVPSHGTTIPAVPVNIILNFNFDLGPDSDIKIIGKDGIDYSIGDLEIDENKLGMRKTMNPESPDGLYSVKYKACWPDGSCHDGMFQFYIDSKTREGFEDLKGQSEIMIEMLNITFKPENIIVDKGTTITWVNKEAAQHYVNTDPHPGHNYYPEQNSSSLGMGDEYSVTFNKEGYYPYHCSVHPGTMHGIIIVE